jgi:hypothetical protein
MPDPIENFNLVEGVNLDDSSFSKEEILESQLIVRQYLSDRYLDLDFSELSSLNDIVIRPMSQIFLVLKSLIQQFSKTNTLLGALELNSSSSEKIVDAILSNFSTTRNTGNLATGRAKILVPSNLSSIIISNSTTLETSSGLQFLSMDNYVATTNPQKSTDLKIHRDTSVSASSFVLLPVIAIEPGTKYNIQEYTPFSVKNLSSSYFISANAFAPFSGGKDKETNDSIISRLVPSISARNLASPASIKQTLIDKFPSITQISVQGINSELMTRNSNNIFGVKCGSYCDVYVKTDNFIKEQGAIKTAQKITTDASIFPDYQSADFIGKYLVKISNEDLPGFYSINRVTPLETDIGTYRIIKQTRGFEKKTNDPINNNTIFSIDESCYSMYSNIEIVFDAGASVFDSMDVVVFAELIPYIKEIQTFVNTPGAQSALIDTLIKAVVPCYISTSEIKVRVKADTVSAEDLQSSVINYINSIDPSVESVRLDGIISTLKSNSNVISVDTPILMTAKILSNTQIQQTVTVVSESVLSIEDRLDLGFTKNNLGFFCRGSAVPLTITEI